MTIYADLPPEIHFSWGVTDVGRCSRCGDFRTMILHSAVHTTSDSLPLCFDCVQASLIGLLHNARDEQYQNEPDTPEFKNGQALYDVYSEVLSQFQDNRMKIQHTREEVLAHPQGCQACACFGQNLVEGVAYSDHSITGMVHPACSTRCATCDMNFYRPYSRGAGGFFNLYRVIAERGHLAHMCQECFDHLNIDDSHTLCDCGNYDTQMFRAWDNEYCRFCAENIGDCEWCGVLRWTDGDHECDDHRRVIKSYDFVPSGGFVFHGDSPLKHYLGFELEVEQMNANNLHDNACYIDDLLGERGYLKYDGSLDDGFEIVTMPHTLEEYMTKFPFDGLDELRDSGFRSWDTDTCGFHVHVSRATFGMRLNDTTPTQGRKDAHMLRFTKLIYDNRRQVRRIAGRSSDRWASFDDTGRLLNKVKTGYQANGRYSAVNISSKRTLEIRVFKGSLNVRRVKAYLQFVHSTVEYTRELHVSPNDNNLMWRRYTGWLHKNEQQYPELVSLLGNLPERRSDEGGN